MNIKRKPVILIGLLIGAIVSFPVLAENMLLNIPVYGTDPNPIRNVVTVAKSGGDYNSPIGALNSIHDADEDNRYTVVIGPGVYHLSGPLVMKPYVYCREWQRGNQTN